MAGVRPCGHHGSHDDTPAVCAVTRASRLRAHWPALLLPALAAEMLSMFRFHDHAPWLLLLAVTVVFAAAMPRPRPGSRRSRCSATAASASSSRTRC